MRTRRVLRTSAVLLVVALGACGGGSGTPKAESTTGSASITTTTAALIPAATADGVRLVPTNVPVGFDLAGAQWIELDRPDGHSQLAAIFTPTGTGPFPTVVYLHGAGGLGITQLQWVARLTAAGYLVVAGCYLAANADLAAANPNFFVPCAGLPPNDQSDTAAITTAYRALLSTAHALGAAKHGSIGVVGVSSGAEVALDVNDPSVAAIVADSGYGAGPPQTVTAPVLFLGHTTDPNVPHTDVVAYEQTLRAAGNDVESHYYDGTGHVATLTAPNVDDATQRTVTFLDQHLK